MTEFEEKGFYFVTGFLIGIIFIIILSGILNMNGFHFDDNESLKPVLTCSNTDEKCINEIKSRVK
jgi:hypothetical protein